MAIGGALRPCGMRSVDPGGRASAHGLAYARRSEGGAKEPGVREMTATVVVVVAFSGTEPQQVLHRKRGPSSLEVRPTR